MAAVTLPSRPRFAALQGWAQESLWATPWQLLGNLLLLALAVAVFRGQWVAAPLVTGVLGGLWLAGVVWVAQAALRHRYDDVSQWLKDRLFGSPSSALITLIIVLWLAAAARGLLNWAIFDASFAAEPAAIREHTGATWGIIFANIKLFLVGQYPRDEVTRIWISVGLVVVLLAAALYTFSPWGARNRAARRVVTGLWLVSPIVIWALLRGLGRGDPLPVVETRFWGGLLLTLVITVFAIVVSFPLGVLLALGRRSQLPGIPAVLTYGVVGVVVVWGVRAFTLPGWASATTTLEYALLLWPVWLAVAAVAFQRAFRGNAVAAASTIFIEFVRGVPLITVLFMAQVMFGLFLPRDISIDNAYRVMWGVALFSAAYLAENVRGGLQAMSKGQFEASDALGLSTFQQYRLVILPQALAIVIPPITGQFINLFKDTSLVAIVGLFDILGIANAVIAQPDWLGLRRETYFFVAAVYYVGCLAMAQVGYWLERRTGLGTR